jgi:hypothetical protein
MAHLIYFRTARFDVTQETPNDINPFAGESVLNWLRAEFRKANYLSSKPEQEDWGWYIDVDGPEAAYMVGACAEVEYKEDAGPAFSYNVEPNASLEWTVQVHKRRSLKDKLLGKNKLTEDDAFCALIERIVRSDSAIENVSLELNNY